MQALDSTTTRQRRGSPLLAELSGVFAALDDAIVLQRLAQYRWTGRPGFSLQALWYSYLAGFVLGLQSTNALIRRLQEDAPLAELCGFQRLPSRWTFNRFVSRLARHSELVEAVFTAATAALRDQLRGAFGHMMAVDSSVITTYSNPDKKRISDPEASWTAKEYDPGRRRVKWHFGYKLHVVTDADTELPIAAIVTTARVNDTTQLLPLLAKAQTQLGVEPRWVLADAGYDSGANVNGVVREYAARPIIKRREMKKLTLTDRTQGHLRQRINQKADDWRAAYSHRVAVERLFARIKGHRSLGKHTRRGLAKVTLQCLSALVVTQAVALYHLAIGDTANLRAPTRRIA